MYFSSSILSDLLEYGHFKDLDLKSFAERVATLQEDKYISYETTVESFNYLGQMLNDEHLGLHIGEQLSLKVTGYVDSIMQYSDTLEKAFENAAQYSKLISDALETSLHKSTALYSVRFVESPNWKVQQSGAKKQILDLTLLSCLKSVVAYTNRKYYPVKIHFETPKPKHQNEYYRLFNCSLFYNQPKTEIFFEKQIFNRYTKTGTLGLLESLKAKVEEEMNTLQAENSLTYELKRCLLSRMPQRITLDSAADDLNLSTRTLQRKLKQLNTSYKEVEGELLLRLSKTYLEEGQKSIDEISYLLGFSESSAFIRFFKSHTGTTPNKYRLE